MGDCFLNEEVITQIQGCFKASLALIRFAGLTVNMRLIRFLASAVTVSHSGEGYYEKRRNIGELVSFYECYALL